MKTLRSPKAIVACVLATLLMTALDLGSKEWATDHLSVVPSFPSGPACEQDARGLVRPQRNRLPAVQVVEGWIEFRYAENCAAAFSLLHSAPLLLRKILFTTAAVIAVIALMWMFVTKRGGPLFAWSVPFVVSGALGNLIDRLRLGYVVDFLHFYAFEWPTFNVADATITVGVVLMLLDSFRKEPTMAEQPAEKPA